MFGNLPEKKYYSISEVATYFDVNASLLRFWEKEFKQIKPMIKASGIRKYPQFAFYCNLPQYIKEPYKRFLENQIRKNYDFSGVPIDIFLRKK